MSRGIDFILLLDMLGLGIIAPVLPKLVLTLTGGDLLQAELDASLTQMNIFTGGSRVVNVFGQIIERVMRACVANSFVPRSIKGFWIFMGVFLIKRRFMHSFQPNIRTQYGNKLAGAPADSS